MLKFNDIYTAVISEVSGECAHAWMGESTLFSKSTASTVNQNYWSQLYRITFYTK